MSHEILPLIFILFASQVCESAMVQCTLQKWETRA